MVEGGPGTVGTVYAAVSKGIPVVIVKGSGRAANVLEYALNISEKLLATSGTVHEELMDQVKELFPEPKPEDVRIYITLVLFLFVIDKEERFSRVFTLSVKKVGLKNSRLNF